MYLRYLKDGGKFIYHSGITGMSVSGSFVEAYCDFGPVVSFPLDCSWQISQRPFPGTETLDRAVSTILAFARSYRGSLKRSDYQRLYAALDGLRQDKN